jgi:hypothetical protein
MSPCNRSHAPQISPSRWRCPLAECPSRGSCNRALRPMPNLGSSPRPQRALVRGTKHCPNRRRRTSSADPRSSQLLGVAVPAMKDDPSDGGPEKYQCSNDAHGDRDDLSGEGHFDHAGIGALSQYDARANPVCVPKGLWDPKISKSRSTGTTHLVRGRRQERLRAHLRETRSIGRAPRRGIARLIRGDLARR